MLTTEESNILLMEQDRITKVINEVIMEVVWARANYPKFASSHEGAAIILEEVDEFWEDVKANKIAYEDVNGKKKGAKVEAKQIAAMAIRYILDIENSKKVIGPHS